MILQRYVVCAGMLLLVGLTPASALATSAIYAEAAASGNTFGFYSLDVRYYSPVGLSVSNSGPLNGNTESYSPVSAPVGLNAITVAASVTGTNSGSAEASVDLGAGTVRAKAGSSNTFNGSGSAHAELYEDLTFAVAGGGSGQVTFLSHLDGSIGSFTTSNSLSGLSYNINLGSSGFSYVSQGSQGGFTFSTNGLGGTSPPTGWDSYSFINVTPTGFDFSGVFTVADGDTRSLAQRLYLICQEGVSCDFSHTGSVGFLLPQGISFTSASGIFLVPPAGGVPEPASWVMLISGFGLVGVTARRRRRFAAAAANDPASKSGHAAEARRHGQRNAGLTIAPPSAPGEKQCVGSARTQGNDRLAVTIVQIHPYPRSDRHRCEAEG